MVRGLDGPASTRTPLSDVHCRHNTPQVILHLVCFVLVVPFILIEWRQIYLEATDTIRQSAIAHALVEEHVCVRFFKSTVRVLYNYIVDPWNVLQFVALGSSIFSLVTPNHWAITINLRTISVFALYANTLYYLRALDATASLVSTLIANVRDMSYFLVLLAIIIFGTSAAFYIQFKVQLEKDLEDDNVWADSFGAC